MEMRAFRTAQAWRAWLEKEHARSEGLLVRLYKKDSGVPSINYAQALNQALCFGWIDGQRLPHDAQSWLQRFTPRRKRSKWSKRNTEHVARLIAVGEMAPAGLREVEAAKADGRWAAAYESPANIQVPPEFLKALARNARAKATFATISRANHHAIAYRLHDAKRPETKLARIAMIVAMLARGETFHPQKARTAATRQPAPRQRAGVPARTKRTIG
jgi:uncharacterized protein YdeI (YjbR/CyaY-like superfamily)